MKIDCLTTAQPVKIVKIYNNNGDSKVDTLRASKVDFGANNHPTILEISKTLEKFKNYRIGNRYCKGCTTTFRALYFKQL